MRVKKIKKKGVSPMIATVMLVGFTVVVVGMVFVWSRGYIEERAQKEEALANTKLKCESVKFEVEEAYQTGGGLHLKIKNSASQRIDAVVLRIKGDNVAATEEGFELKGLETKSLDIGPESFDATAVGEIDTVEIIPEIKAGKNTYVPCSSKMMEARVAAPA